MNSNFAGKFSLWHLKRPPCEYIQFLKHRKVSFRYWLFWVGWGKNSKFFPELTYCHGDAEDLTKGSFDDTLMLEKYGLKIEGRWRTSIGRIAPMNQRNSCQENQRFGDWKELTVTRDLAGLSQTIFINVLRP